MWNKTKAVWILAIVVLLILIGIFFLIVFVIPKFKSTTEQIRYHSDMSLLNSVIREQMKDYYDINGKYPQDLKELESDIIRSIYTSKAPENPKELKMLEEFVYVTDGIKYEISWDAAQGDKIYTHKEYAKNGKLYLSEMYLNGQLHSKTEF
ncbi:MAG: hypothetical protein ACYSSO_06185 [Planctomycetota bacterium]|jgi:competence protein ComGC